MLMLLIIGNMQVRSWGGMYTWFYFGAGIFCCKLLGELDA
jgi:hypothetical protein